MTPTRSSASRQAALDATKWRSPKRLAAARGEPLLWSRIERTDGEGAGFSGENDEIWKDRLMLSEHRADIADVERLFFMSGWLLSPPETKETASPLEDIHCRKHGPYVFHPLCGRRQAEQVSARIRRCQGFP